MAHYQIFRNHDPSDIYAEKPPESVICSLFPLCIKFSRLLLFYLHKTNSDNKNISLNVYRHLSSGGDLVKLSRLELRPNPGEKVKWGEIIG